MPLTGLALVLAAAVCHATWNVLIKRLNSGPELLWLFSVVALLLYFPAALWVILTQRPTFDLWQTFFIVGSVILHLGYFLLLQTGYRKGDLSLVYPTARSTGPVLSTAFAVAFLAEKITPQMALGAAIIIFGVLMLTGGIRLGGNRLSASLFFGLAAGTLIGSYTAWDAYTVSVLIVSPILLDYASHIGRAVLLSPIALRRRAEVCRLWQDHRGAVFIIAAFNPLAYILVLYAMTFTPVAYVAPLRETSVLLAVLAGSLLLGEGQLKWRLSWAMVILIGMVLLVTSKV